MKNILVEGWRGISQSYALVNQYQLIELLKLPQLSIAHRDMPFAESRWHDPSNNPGFPSATAASIRDIPYPSVTEFDCVYRICSPFGQTASVTKRAITFMTGEFGLTHNHFANRQFNVNELCSADDLVVVPSNWSKLKMTEYGFPAAKVHVISHGINPEMLYPSTESERLFVRSHLGFSPEHFVFLNLGAMTWNKGVDYLLRAFSDIHYQFPNARLVFKDSSSLYGTTTAKFIEEFSHHFGHLRREVWEAISVVPPTQSIESMRQLYSAADCYVSPYRAEGFNLPVIEAIACGTPVIVTDGGATDDFCELRTSLKVESDRILNSERDLEIPGFHLEPRMDSLVEQMRKVVTGEFCADEAFVGGWLVLRETYSWKACVDKLVKLF